MTLEEKFSIKFNWNKKHFVQQVHLRLNMKKVYRNKMREK